MNQPYVITIGLVLESLRLQRDLTIASAARISRVSRRTIVRIESEVSRPSSRTLRQLAYAYSIDSSRLEDIQEKLEAAQDRYKSKKFPQKSGSQSQRDRQFPEFRNSEFRKWWHRVGKAQYGGLDIQSHNEARRIYEEWQAEGSPRVKILTRSEIKQFLK